MKIPNTLLAAITALAIGLLSGCSTTSPIKTTLDLKSTEAGLPMLNYSSEKDVLYSRTTADGEIVEFKALASAAAYAQAEREKVQAEASRARAEALSAAVQALGANAAGVLGQQQAPVVE